MKNESTIVRADRHLIGDVLKFGDEQAFRELYRRHTPRLLGFVSRLLPAANPEDEDIVQETWIRACEQLRQFEWKSTFSTWLLGIGLNVVRGHLRRSKNAQTAANNLLLKPPIHDGDLEARIDLSRAIQVLPDDYRMALVLHDIEGFTHAEIAEQLEIPVGTTKSQLFRARRMIREWLSARNGVRP